MRAPRWAVATLVWSGLGVAACSSDPPASLISVIARDKTCEADKTEIPAGSLTVNVRNRGTKLTEVYVYAEGDRPLGEVEFVRPLRSGEFTVEIGGGDYEIACKPRMLGQGIRSELHVTGPTTTLDPASADPATFRGTPGFGVKLDATDRGFIIDKTLTIVQGQTVTFQMHNDSRRTDHQFLVIGPDGKVAGKTKVTPPGGDSEVTLKLDQLGTHRFVDPIGDHRADGLHGTFVVIE